MSQGFLLSRVKLCFQDKGEKIIKDMSAIIQTPDGNLWIGSDELLGIEKISPIGEGIFGNHKHFFLGDFVELFNSEDEIDIEGLSYSNGYIWVTGSHSTKRGKPKGKDEHKDIEKLAKIKLDLNRFLIARIPVIKGELVKSYENPELEQEKLTAASLEKIGDRNILIETLKEDEHLGKIISIELPSKDNGLDIEGIAVRDNRIFLGLRGPVLRGWAIILEIEVEESTPGILKLKHFEEVNRTYKKHFIHLDGLGIRDLCWYKNDLIILAGATMTLESLTRVYKLSKILKSKGDTIFSQEEGKLEILFDLPSISKTDFAEGITLFPYLGEENGILVVYDSPDDKRIINSKEILGDVFRLN